VKVGSVLTLWVGGELIRFKIEFFLSSRGNHLGHVKMVIKKINAKFISNLVSSAKVAWNRLVEAVTPAPVLAYA
jgi:hypothetical protein